MLRYQWLGYWKTVAIDYTDFSAKSLLNQLDRTISNHMKISMNNGYCVQRIQISSDQVYVLYRGFRKQKTYVLGVLVDRKTNRALFEISRSTKAYAREIEPDDWNFEYDYFSTIFGADCGYRFNNLTKEDQLIIYDNNDVYSANLYDGSYELLMSFSDVRK
jgi:hypothetical protein